MAFDVTSYPYRTIVYITDNIGGTSLQGSGVMLSPDEVLTASHVVYTAGVGAATNIIVTPAYNAGSSPFGSSSVQYYHYFLINNANDLISNETSQTDYAILHLSRPLNVGWMGYEANFSGGPAHSTGYPTYANGAMIDMTETVYRDRQFTLLDGVDTDHGSSGGPVWIDGPGGPNVVGIVSSGVGTVGYNVQITSQVFSQIQTWISQDDYKDPLVDAAYYLQHNPDVASTAINPAIHFNQSGWKEGRDPNAFFHERYYLNQNPDVAAAGINPLTQYHNSGWQEGRDPSANFSTKLYLSANPDVASAHIDPLMHYLTSGRAEGRMSFSAQPHGVGAQDPLVDNAYYFAQYVDVRTVGVDPFAHYDAAGWHELRNPDALFDTAYYLQHNLDVKAAAIDPLLHYEQFGWKEGRNPSALFSTSKYLAANADVKAAGINPLVHYEQSGIHEGRPIFNV